MIPTFEDVAMIKCGQQQRCFDIKDYQHQDLKAASELLRIPWSGKDTMFRMPGMQISKSFEFWQPPGIMAMVDWANVGSQEECDLVDAGFRLI